MNKAKTSQRNCREGQKRNRRAQPCKLIAEKGVNILAVHGTVEGENGIVRFVTNDNLQAVDGL
jgi:hypothetical protein